LRTPTEAHTQRPRRYLAQFSIAGLCRNFRLSRPQRSLLVFYLFSGVTKRYAYSYLDVARHPILIRSVQHNPPEWLRHTRRRPDENNTIWIHRRDVQTKTLSDRTRVPPDPQIARVCQLTRYQQSLGCWPYKGEWPHRTFGPSSPCKVWAVKRFLGLVFADKHSLIWSTEISVERAGTVSQEQSASSGSLVCIEAKGKKRQRSVLCRISPPRRLPCPLRISNNRNSTAPAQIRCAQARRRTGLAVQATILNGAARARTRTAAAGTPRSPWSNMILRCLVLLLASRRRRVNGLTLGSQTPEVLRVDLLRGSGRVAQSADPGIERSSAFTARSDIPIIGLRFRAAKTSAAMGSAGIIGPAPCRSCTLPVARADDD